MTRAELAVAHVALHGRRQLEEPQRVGDRGPGAADLARNLLVGEIELLDQLLVGAGLVKRVEILAMQVLDQASSRLMASSA